MGWKDLTPGQKKRMELIARKVPGELSAEMTPEGDVRVTKTDWDTRKQDSVVIDKDGQYKQ
jgi:hypothetical protein